MTAPDLSSIIPLKYKTYVAAASTVLAVVVPYVLQFAVYLPNPWPAVVGCVIAILGIIGVYKAPYKPTGTVLVPEVAKPTVTNINVGVGQVPNDTVSGKYQSTWRT